MKKPHRDPQAEHGRNENEQFKRELNVAVQSGESWIEDPLLVRYNFAQRMAIGLRRTQRNNGERDLAKYVHHSDNAESHEVPPEFILSAFPFFKERVVEWRR